MLSTGAKGRNAQWAREADAHAASETKALIAQWDQESHAYAASGTYEKLAIAMVLRVSCIEQLLKLEYWRMIRAGTIVASRHDLSMPHLCKSIVAGLKVEDRSNDWVTQNQLTFVRRLGNTAKHSAYQRINDFELAGGVMVAGGIVRVLFEQYYGESLPDWSDEEEDEYEIPMDRALPLLLAGVRRRITPVLVEDEIDLYDVLEHQFVAGLAHWITLRELKTPEQLHQLGRRQLSALTVRIHNATLADAELIIAEETLRVLADLKTFIAAEAHAVRMRRPAIAILTSLSDAEIEVLPDAEIALGSVLNRLIALWDDRNAA